ncbi:hypothetical protein Tco_0296400 [Tanacetum coccineum]
MENGQELTYETLTRVYLGSYEHYKSVEIEVEHPEPGFELQGAKMVEMGRFRILDKIINDKDYSLVFRVFELMKWVSEDPSYVTGGEPKYPQELFSAVDLLFLQFLAGGGWAYAFHQDKASLVRVPVENVTLSFSAHLLRENTDSVRSNQRMRNFSGTIVPIGIVGICHGSSLCFQSGGNTISNELLDGS